MSDWTAEQVAAWRAGKWTREKVDALDRECDDHILSCDDCGERMRVPPDLAPKDEPYFCPVGESLLEASSQAEVEFSHQPDFLSRPLRLLP